MAKKELTVKQEKFCNKYLECGNASEAYRFAYDCSKMGENATYREASLLLSDPKIAQRLDYLKNNLAEAAGISALMIIREHQKIAFSDATRVRNGWMALKDYENLTEDEKACIKSIETKQTKRVTPMGDEVIDEWVKLTLYDKQKSLDAIWEKLGYNPATQIELMGKGGKELFPNIQVEIIDRRDNVESTNEDSDE